MTQPCRLCAPSMRPGHQSKVNVLRRAAVVFTIQLEYPTQLLILLEKKTISKERCETLTLAL